MDKINTQKFNLSLKKGDISKADDVLGSLFSVPLINDEKQVKQKTINELIVNPSIEKILNSKKSSKTIDKLDIMYKDFFSGISQKKAKSPIFKDDQVFDFNSKKAPDILSIDLKLNKLTQFNNVKKQIVSKLIKNDITKDLDMEFNASDESEIRTSKASTRKLEINSSLNLINKNNVKKNVFNKENLEDIFFKIDHLKDDINSTNFDNKIMLNNNEIIYKKLKANIESNNYSNNNDQINKVENSNLRNNSSQHQFNNEKNMHFILDQMIDELDMSKLGWTEKLILRIEKGLNEDEKQIELALKPKELGNLKINLKIKDKSANIIMKVENAASMVALQSNEGLLTKTLLDQGFILEKINFENSLMSSNKENKNSSENNKENNFKKDERTNLDEVENNKDDNLNYLININA